MHAIRILLVDDSPVFIRSAVSFLNDICNVDVVGCASSGEQALDMVATLSPQIVLMDVVMPGMSGIEAARRIKQLPNPPYVVLVTLDSDQYSSEAISELPGEGLICKSVFTSRIPDLLNKVSLSSSSRHS